MHTSETSRLCKDIYELEKDFRYNLFLLNVRETEIERYKKQNQQLAHSIQQKDKEHIRTHSKITELEREVNKITIDKANMKINCEQTIREFTAAEKQTKDLLEIYKSSAEKRLKQTTTEMERKYMCELAEKDANFQCYCTEMDDRLQKEIRVGQILKIRVKELTDENLKQHAQFHEKQSFFLSKISVLESELEQTKIDRQKLVSAHEISQNKSICLLSDVERLQSEWNQLKRESEAIAQSSKRNFQDVSIEKDNLCHQLELCQKELETCRENVSKLALERDQFKRELQQCNTDTCAVAKHTNIDNIIKQNSILQEVIKSMRKERNGDELEIKIRKLEELVSVLKESMLNQVCVESSF